MTPLQQQKKDEKTAAQALAAARKPVNVGVTVYLGEPAAWDGGYLWQAELVGACPITGRQQTVYVVEMTMAEALASAGRALAPSFSKHGAPAGYRPGGQSQTQQDRELAPHEQRVVQEHQELTERLSRLVEFVDGEVFNGLPYDDKKLLWRQREAMVELAFVLAKRIERFKPAGADSEGGEV